MRIMVLLLAMASTMVFGQTGISGQAPVSLNTAGTDCGGECVAVEVAVDVSGLMGNGEPVGLNAFVLVFDLNRSDVFASAIRGDSPSMNWSFFQTDRDNVNLTNRLTLVGAVADELAPNQNYQVASITLCGTPGDVDFTFVETESSLGSRLVNGDGPGQISILAPSVFTTSLTVNLSLTWGVGIESWLAINPDYDLVSPTGSITIQDLVKLVSCGLP